MCFIPLVRADRVVTVNDMEQLDDRRRLRHDLRGAFHNLRLCVEVLARETDPAEALPWLEQLEQAATDCDRHAGELNDLPDIGAAANGETDPEGGGN